MDSTKLENYWQDSLKRINRFQLRKGYRKDIDYTVKYWMLTFSKIKVKFRTFVMPTPSSISHGSTKDRTYAASHEDAR